MTSFLGPIILALMVEVISNFHIMYKNRSTFLRFYGGGQDELISMKISQGDGSDLGEMKTVL